MMHDQEIEVAFNTLWDRLMDFLGGMSVSYEEFINFCWEKTEQLANDSNENELLFEEIISEILSKFELSKYCNGMPEHIGFVYGMIMGCLQSVSA